MARVATQGVESVELMEVAAARETQEVAVWVEDLATETALV